MKIKLILVAVLFVCINAEAKKDPKKKNTRAPANIVSFLSDIWNGDVKTNSDWKDEPLPEERHFISIIRNDLTQAVSCKRYVNGVFDRSEIVSDLIITNGSENSDESWIADLEFKQFNVRINRKLKMVMVYYPNEAGTYAEIYEFNHSMNQLSRAVIHRHNEGRYIKQECDL